MVKTSLGELIRDLTKTMPIPVAKSYARKRVLEFLAELEREVEELRKVKVDNLAGNPEKWDISVINFNQALDKVLSIIKERLK